MEADASNYAVGGVVSQVAPDDGKLHPIAFYSRTLNPAEQNYEIYDKEMLAIVESLKHYRHLFEGLGQQITIYSDHHNLLWFTEDPGEAPRWKDGRPLGTGEDARSGDPGIYVARDTRFREPVHSNLRHLRTEQDSPAPASWAVAAPPHSPRAVEVSLNGFYHRTPLVPRV